MPRTIDREELRSKLQASTPPLVVEALPPQYYQAGHLPGAINVPLASSDDDVSRALPEPSTPVITYCTDLTCNNSRQLAERLETLGFADVRVYVGGKSDWSEAQLPLEEGG